MRLDVNLAGRPFVNRLPHAILLGALAAAAVGLTTLNAALFLRSQSEERAVQSHLEELAAEEAALRERRAAVQAQLAGKDIAPLEVRVAAANDVLAQRAISWTLLLQRLEELLPWSAALRSIRTNVSPDGIRLEFELRARTYEDALDFIDALERSPCFAGAYPRTEKEENGEYDFTVETLHDPYCGEGPPLDAVPRPGAAGRRSRRG